MASVVARQRREKAQMLIDTVMMDRLQELLRDFWGDDTEQTWEDYYGVIEEITAIVQSTGREVVEEGL